MSGLLGKASSIVGNNLIGTVPSCDYASVGVSISNTTGSAATFKLYLSPGTSVSNVDRIGPDIEIPPGGSADVECIIASAGEKIYVNSTVAGAAIRASVITETA